METKDLLNYILSQISQITDKYKSLNICNVGENKYCVDDKSKYKLGFGCCFKCNHHSPSGCTIVNLCCISYFCNSVKNSIEESDWVKLKSTVILLQSFGLDARQSWEQQIRILDSKKIVLNIINEDLYQIFKRIYE